MKIEASDSFEWNANMEQDCRFAKIFLDTSINFNVEILRVLDVFCAKKTLYFARLDDVHMNLFIISEKWNKVRLRWLSETYQLRPRP